MAITMSTGMSVPAEAGGTAVASMSFQCASTFSQWDLIIVCVGGNNAGTAGAKSIVSVTDSKGHTYTERVVKLKSNAGATNDSGSVAIWTAECGAAGMASTDNITIGFSPNTARVLATCYKATAAAGKYYSFQITDDFDGFSTSEGKQTASNINNGDCVIFALAAETDETCSQDSDTTNGTWAGMLRGVDDSGTATTSQSFISEYKIVTATATQTFNGGSFVANCDWECVCLSIREETAVVPNSPGYPTVTPNAAGQFGLDWSDVGTPVGGRPVTNYHVQWSTDNSTWNNYGYVGSATSALTVTGFTGGVLYYFRVAAVNAIGTSSYGPSASGTAWGVPNAPTITSSTPNAAGQIVVGWSVPGNNGTAITDYVIQYRLSPAGSWNTFAEGTSTTASATVTGLSNGTAYDFRVAAVNAVGQGAYSATDTETTWDVPGAPPNLTGLNEGDGDFFLDWDSP